METKKIILNEGQVKEMNFEQVLEQFKPLINRYVTRWMNMSRTQDRDDYEQIAMIQVFECFVDYDEVHAFSTRLMTKLKGETSRIASYDSSEKRTKYETSSAQSISENDENTGSEFDIFGDVDMSIDQYCENELVKEIYNQLNPQEKRMYALVIDGGMNLNKFAEITKSSRQAERYRYKKLVKKLHNLYVLTTNAA